MSAIHGSIINSCVQLYQQFEAVEKQSPLTSQECYKLLEELDHIIVSIADMEKMSDSVDEFSRAHIEQLSALKEKIVTSFGNIHSQAVDFEVIEIKNEAESLEGALPNSNFLNLAKKVDSLRKHISTFCYEHALSLDNRTIISSVKNFIEAVETYMKIFEESPEEAIALLEENSLHLSLDPKELRTQQAILAEQFQCKELDPETAELLMEIFEVAELYSLSDLAAGKKKFEKLPQHIQRRIENHIHMLNEVSKGESSEILIYLQALIGSASELANNGKFPALEEIEMFYKDLDYILAEEAREGSLSFRSQQSVGT
jgi:hypothetical protein